MNLFRLLALLAVIWIIFHFAKRMLPRPTTERRPEVVRKMVRCDHCGLHVPENESIRAKGGHFCCPEHRDA